MFNVDLRTRRIPGIFASSFPSHPPRDPCGWNRTSRAQVRVTLPDGRCWAARPTPDSPSRARGTGNDELIPRNHRHLTRGSTKPLDVTWQPALDTTIASTMLVAIRQADRADAGIAQMRRRSRRAARARRRVVGMHASATRRRTGRSASPRPCPDDRPRRARAGRRSSSACSRGVRARASAGRRASAVARCTTSSTALPARRGRAPGGRARSRGAGSDGSAGSSPSSPSIDVVEITALRRTRSARLNDSRARSACCSSLGASALAAICVASQPSSSRSALYQSALISTALPRRGVTTQSSTFASIHVS